MHGERSDHLFIKIHSVASLTSLTNLTHATDRLAANPGATDKTTPAKSMAIC